MTTTTSSFNAGRFLGLYRGILRRNRGYLWLYSALVAVCYPLLYALEAFKSVDPSEIAFMREMNPGVLAANPMYFYAFEGPGRNFAGVSIVFFPMVALLAPMILALVLNSYMHSKKASDVYHALPVSRGMLLTANAAAGMTVVGLPLVVSNLFIAAVQIAKFGFLPGVFGHLWLDALGWMVCSFAIYAITTFVSVCAGTVFDTFVLSGTLLLAAPILSGLGVTVTEMFLFGWQSGGLSISTILRLSPVTLMIERMGFWDSSADAAWLLGANLALLVWLLIGLFIFWAAARVYRRRHTEAAETTTSRGVLQVLVKLIGTAVCGIFAGLIASAGNNSESSFLLWAALIGALAYAVAEAVLNRGFKTFVRGLPLGAGMVCAVLLLCLIPMTGAFGYEDRVPAAPGVAQVEISYAGRFGDSYSIYRVAPDMDPGDNDHSGVAVDTYGMVKLTSPEDLAAVEAFHRDAVEKKYRPYRGFALEPGEEFIHNAIQMTYTLRNGRTLTRRYDGAGSGSYRKLAQLEASHDLLAQVHPAFFDRGQDIVTWEISDAFGSKTVEKAWPAADSQALLDAMKADLLAQSAEELLHPSDGLAAVVRFTAKLPPEGAERATDTGVFYVTGEGRQTARFLREKGVLDEISPDLDACYAVGLRDEGYYGPEAAVVRMSQPDRGVFTANDFASLKKEIEDLRRYYAGDPDALALDYDVKEGGEWTYEGGYAYTARAQRAGAPVLIEDREDIAALAGAVTATWAAGEPAVYADFWFEGAASGASVLIPLSRLPEDLRQRIEYPYGVPGEQQSPPK